MRAGYLVEPACTRARAIVRMYAHIYVRIKITLDVSSRPLASEDWMDAFSRVAATEICSPLRERNHGAASKIKIGSNKDSYKCYGKIER